MSLTTQRFVCFKKYTGDCILASFIVFEAVNKKIKFGLCFFFLKIVCTDALFSKLINAVKWETKPDNAN